MYCITSKILPIGMNYCVNLLTEHNTQVLQIIRSKESGGLHI